MSGNRKTTLVLLSLVALLTGVGVWFAQGREAAREQALAPTPTRSELERAATELSAPESDDAQRQTIAALARATTKAIKTNEQGRFEVGGLVDRDYRLQLFDQRTFVRLESEPIHAGARGVEIAFPHDALLPTVPGRIVGRDGVEIAGARVNFTSVTERIPSSTSQKGPQGVVSASDGSFRIDVVPRRIASMDDWFDGRRAKSGSPGTFDLDRPIEIVIGRQRSFRVDNMTVSDTPAYVAARRRTSGALNLRPDRASETRLEADGALCRCFDDLHRKRCCRRGRDLLAARQGSQSSPGATRARHDHGRQLVTVTARCA